MPLRVLMVLYHFPPVEDIASNRARRLVKHLPTFGVEPIVVTGATGRARVIQTEDLDGTPVRVMRVQGWDPIAWFQGRSRSRTERTVERTDPRARAAALTQEPPPRWKRAKRLLRSLLVPDDKIGWITPWMQAGREAAEEGIDLVYSSSAPYSAHLAASRLARTLNLPWVMEMRDLWSGNRYIPQTDNPLSRLLQDQLERRYLARAWRVVVPSRAHANDIAERHPAVRKRVHVIPNMFDVPETDRVSSRPAPGEEPLRLLYTGNFYGGRTLETLGRAVDAVDGRLRGFRSARLEVAGQSFDLPWSTVLGGIDEHRTLHGILPRRQVSALLERVHAGVLHNPSWDTIHIPGKLYEYLGAGLPVLDLSRQPDIPEICRGTVPCWKVDPREEEQLVQALHEIAAWWVEHPEGPIRPGSDHPFASPRVSGVLARLFLDVNQGVGG